MYVGRKKVFMEYRARSLQVRTTSIPSKDLRHRLKIRSERSKHYFLENGLWEELSHWEFWCFGIITPHFSRFYIVGSTY